MKNLKIGTKILVGFILILSFLLIIAITSIGSTIRTNASIDKADIYSGLQSSSNELMHILNETRISAGVLYETHSAGAYANVSKQLLYCDMRLGKLYQYIDSNSGISEFRPKIEEFELLYKEWREGIVKLGSEFSLEDGLTEGQMQSFNSLAGEMNRVNLLAHEILSNTIQEMDEKGDRTMQQTKTSGLIGLYIVAAASLLSIIAAMPLAVLIMRSITVPMGRMRDVLGQIGQTGNMQLPEKTYRTLREVAKGRDETAQCISALLVLVDRLHDIDESLALVAGGNLMVDVNLQSEADTMGLAVKKMVENLNNKFMTIAGATNSVHQKADELADGSRLLSDGSQRQAESVSYFAQSVREIGQKSQKSTELSKTAARMIGDIQRSAQTGTDKMDQMMQAAADINAASQAIEKVIKTIDDIAFQTNILALNAAVEAARAGSHGKGFAVVAEEVRNLATKSAEAAKTTGTLIQDTIQKAALGTSISKLTFESLREIVDGVIKSHAVINEISSLSTEQLSDIQGIVDNVGQVEAIVRQNTDISAQSAQAANEISNQSTMLKGLVAQFQLNTPEGMAFLPARGEEY